MTTLDSGAPGGEAAVGAPPSGTLLQRALEAWRTELSELAGPDTLLGYRDLPLGTLELTTAHPSGLAGFLAGRPSRLSDLFREQTALDGARERARHLRQAAARLTEGYGLPGTRLGIGLVEWTDRSTVVPVTAPVLLRSLSLRARGSGDLDLVLDGPAWLNPALLGLLHQHGVRVDEDALLSLAGDEHGFTPRRVLDRLRAEIAAPSARFGDSQPIVHDRTVVGLFTDLARGLTGDLERVAPELSSHRFVQALLGSGQISADRAESAPGPVQAPRDGDLTPLDPSQRAVVEAVARGRDVRVEAPVGSGATQVAAQLVVEAARTGRSVLVVAPRRGPLDDLVTRLGEYGLSRLLPLVTAADTDGEDDGAAPADAAGARRARSAAGDLAARRALHDARPRWGASRLDVLRALAATGHGAVGTGDVVPLPPATLQALAGAEARREATRLLAEAADVAAYSDLSTSSPWVGAEVSSVEEAEAALAALDRLRGSSLAEARGLMDDLAHDVGVRSGGSVSDWGDQLDLFVAVRATLDVFLPAIYERPLDQAVAATASSQWRERHDIEMTGRERRRWRRQAAELVRPGMKPDDLHAALVAAEKERRQWHRVSGSRGQPHVPLGLGIADSAYRRVSSDLSFLERVLAATSGATDLTDLPLDSLMERLDGLAEARDDLAVLPRRTSVLAALDGLGLTDLVGQLRAEGAGRDVAAARLEMAWYRGVLVAMDLEDRGIVTPGDSGPQTDARAAASGSGPRASAQGTTALALPFLPGLSSRVDTVLLLEGQRLGLAEALPAVARGRQVVVVGDPHGLRPSTLDAVDHDMDEPVPQRTSVLDATSGRLMTLRLDHRHRSPAQLVEVGEALLAGDAREPRWQVPSPVPQPARLEVVEDGIVPVTASPEEASPPQEVARVVELVLAQVRTQPQQSLAVLTPGRGHARAVAEAVRRSLAQEPELTAWFTRATDEPFVVADLARAEDTVRDHVILSLGIGRTPHGRVVHRFGRLDDEGGNRLVGLGVGQARLRLTVVSSLTADQLDPERTSSDGARALRRLLQVLPTHTEESPALGAPPTGDAVLGRLVSALRTAGHEVGTAARAVPDEAPESDDELDLDFGPSPLRRKRSGRSAGASGRRDGWQPDPATHPDLLVRVAGSARPVAVLWDGRRPGDEPADAVAGDQMLTSALERFGWSVARVRASEIVSDAEAVVAQVVAQAGVPGDPDPPD